MTRLLRTTFTLIAVLSLLGLAPGFAKPSSSPVVQRIEVEGNHRVEDASVVSNMTLRIGQPFSQELVDQSLKALYGTGLFADVQIDLRKGRAVVVTVKVVENPLINRVAFEGNSKIPKKTLEDEVQLKPRMLFTRAKLQSDAQRILQIYHRSGRLSAEVEPT